MTLLANLCAKAKTAINFQWKCNKKKLSEKDKSPLSLNYNSFHKIMSQYAFYHTHFHNKYSMHQHNINKGHPVIVVGGLIKSAEFIFTVSSFTYRPMEEENLLLWTVIIIHDSSVLRRKKEKHGKTFTVKGTARSHVSEETENKSKNCLIWHEFVGVKWLSGK